MVKLIKLKVGWSHCHRCGRGNIIARNKLALNLKHGHKMQDIWLCDTCLIKLIEELKEVANDTEVNVNAP